MEISSNHTFRLPAARPAVWDALGAVCDYRTWWPWLRRFEASGLDEGDVWRCAIRPPLPYVLRCTVELTTVQAPALVVAQLDGDIVGDARLDLTDAGPHTEARITSHLRARRLPARLLARLAPPVARWGHDWVFATAARQFERALVPPVS
ncbi:MAG TPA: hypothetical protein VIL48_14695 [Acidimicrobiales bacterium]